MVTFWRTSSAVRLRSARGLRRMLNDPEFHATRSREAHSLVTELESAKAEVARLYARWQELEGIAKGGK